MKFLKFRDDAEKVKTCVTATPKEPRREAYETVKNGLLFTGQIITNEIAPTLKEPRAITLQNAKITSI